MSLPVTRQKDKKKLRLKRQSHWLTQSKHVEMSEMRIGNLENSNWDMKELFYSMPYVWSHRRSSIEYLRYNRQEGAFQLLVSQVHHLSMLI